MSNNVVTVFRSNEDFLGIAGNSQQNLITNKEGNSSNCGSSIVVAVVVIEVLVVNKRILSYVVDSLS